MSRKRSAKMKRPSKIAVIGAGLVGAKHARLVRELADLAAVVDPSAEGAAVAAELNAPHFPDVHSYLSQASPDGAIIATPNQLHRDHALACIAAGVPILAEKPLADDSASAQEIVKAGDSANIPILVGHHRRHNPLIAQAKQVIAAGQLGDIRLVNGQFWLYKPDAYFDVPWRRQPGAGPIFINLIHDIDLLRHLCGDIRAVTATGSNAARGFAVEDTAAMILEFANGALGTVTVSDAVVSPWSWEFAAHENPAYPETDTSSYVIGGSHGSLSIPDLTFWSQPQGRDWWKPIKSERVPFDSDDPLIRQIHHFCDVLEQGASPIVSGAEGLATLQVVEAIQTAIVTGERQVVPT